MLSFIQCSAFLGALLERFVLIPVLRRVWRLAEKTLHVQRLRGEGGTPLKIVQDPTVLLVRALHVLPLHELAHMLGERARLFHVEMPVGQFGCTAFVHKIQVLQQQAEMDLKKPIYCGGSIEDKIKNWLNHNLTE